jgi:surface polysaccharide O-acyltransferase-like enzyme
MTNKADFQGGRAVPGASGRQYYLDWLRVLAILSVFFIHCGKIFDYQTQVVFNIVRSPVLSVLREFVLIWIMPLIFVISGAAVFLSFRKAGMFTWSRIRRLLIPAILVGTLIINPPYVYVERLFSGKTASGFFQWYPRFFDGMYGFGSGNFAPWGMGTHIWYLQFLFIYSLILLPLFVRSRNTGVSLLQRLSSFFEKPWALFLLFLPVSAVAAAFEFGGLGGVRITGNWDLISYIFFFIYGYLVFSSPQIQESIRKHCVIYLVVAVVLTAFHLASHFGVLIRIEGVTGHDLTTGALLPLDHSRFAVIQALRGLLAWCWVIALLGLGSRFLNFNSRVLAYSNEAVLPFYMLHHTVIYVIGYHVIQWSSGVGTKFFVIAVISFVVILALYDILIRRLNFLRILFGMKSKKHEASLKRSRIAKDGR